MEPGQLQIRNALFRSFVTELSELTVLAGLAVLVQVSDRMHSLHRRDLSGLKIETLPGKRFSSESPQGQPQIPRTARDNNFIFDFAVIKCNE